MSPFSGSAVTLPLKPMPSAPVMIFAVAAPAPGTAHVTINRAVTATSCFGLSCICLWFLDLFLFRFGLNVGFFVVPPSVVWPAGGESAVSQATTAILRTSNGDNVARRTELVVVATAMRTPMQRRTAWAWVWA
jgi:hypothetical protein